MEVVENTNLEEIYQTQNNGHLAYKEGNTTGYVLWLESELEGLMEERRGL